MKILTVGATMFVMAAAVTAGQVPVQPPVPVSAAQKMFEAGQYDQALQAIAEAREREQAGVFDAFVAAQAQMRRSQGEAAKGEFARLVESGDETWSLVGESAIAYVDQNLDRALELATQAVNQINERNAQAAEAAGGQLPAQDVGVRVRDAAAFYQLGFVKSRREDWAGAAEAFDRAAQFNPSFAYARYYAGLAYSRMRRPVDVAARFEVFLKLAPNAPERASVTSIMRTIRGA